MLQKGLSDKPTAAASTGKTVKTNNDSAKAQKKVQIEEPVDENYGPPVSRLITDLFRTIAIEESDVST
jgi:hypothetical protein